MTQPIRFDNDMPEVISAEELAEATGVDIEVVESGDEAAAYFAAIAPKTE